MASRSRGSAKDERAVQGGYPSIAHTGVREGEVIMGIPGREQSQGIEFSVRVMSSKRSSDDITLTFPPLRHWVAGLSELDLRDLFRQYKFFSPLTVPERKAWLEAHLSEYENLYLNNLTNLELKFHQIGNKRALKEWGQELVDWFLAQDYLPIHEVYMHIPPGKGRARKPLAPGLREGGAHHMHTLFFRPSLWMVKPDVRPQVEAFTGWCVVLPEGQVLKVQVSRDKVGLLEVVKLGSVEVAIVAPPGDYGDPLTRQRLEALWVRLGLDVAAMDALEQYIAWFSPAPLKSLLQKILRVRCSEVVGYHQATIPAREALILSLSLLMLHPGSFVPDIQRFNTGLESALKRLAVSIQEDAYLGPEYQGRLVALYAATWLVQSDDQKKFVPSDAMILDWFEVALAALEDPRCFDYHWRGVLSTAGAEATFQQTGSGLMLCHLLLRELRSFEGDIKMLYDIAQKEGRASPVWVDRAPVYAVRPMPLYHCIDHHSFPNIIHYIPYGLVNSAGPALSATLGLLWDRLVGCNARKARDLEGQLRSSFRDMPALLGSPDPVVRSLQDAQILLWLVKSKLYTQASILPKLEAPELRVSYSLEPDWLAALVGPLEFNLRGVGVCIAVIDPNDIFVYKAIKKSSRDKEAARLTDDQQEQVLAAFRERLRQGVPLREVPESLGWLRGAIVRLVEEDSKYMVDLPGSGGSRDWIELLQLNYRFAVHPASSFQPRLESQQVVLESLRHRGQGLRQEGKTQWLTYLESLPTSVLQRALVYLGKSSKVELFGVARDGTGTDYEVVNEDVAVHHLLCVMCHLFPGALEHEGVHFRVTNGPLFWILTRLARETLQRKPGILTGTGSISNSASRTWFPPTPETARLYPFQEEAIADLLKYRHLKKARLMWVTTGLGKTRIISNYIARLIEAGTMCRYCLYVVPRKALQSVAAEFEVRSLRLVHLNPTATASPFQAWTSTLQPGYVNFVYDDHLHHLDLDQLKAAAGQTLLVVDEVHKHLNPTKRTSISLQLAQLCSETIAMTGTMIKDGNIGQLLPWLAMAVQFEVTLGNFWVAMLSIFSRTSTLDVVIDRQEVEVPLSPAQEQAYYAVVPPSLGGTASRIDFRAATEISYEALYRGLEELVWDYVRSGQGVFVVARHRRHQDALRAGLIQRGLPATQIQAVSESGSGLNYTPSNSDPPGQSGTPWVVIGLPSQAEGYNLSRYSVMVTGVYFSNHATREQLEARINRQGQTSPALIYRIVHAGILSRIYQHYEKARTLSEALKGFSREVGDEVTPGGLS